jgi:hypothetical protein
MQPRKLLFLIVLVCALAVLAACSLGPNPARATLQATASPPPAATATETYPPTATEYPPTSPATATLTPTQRPSSTATGATETGTAPAGTDDGPPISNGAAIDKAEFVADVTVPDGTNFTPGEAFVKTWRLKNTGTTTWTRDYLLVFVRGEQMGGPPTVAMPESVAPGETIELSVDMTAPERLGSHTGFWQFRTPAGQPFGIGPEANQPIYVQINVTVDGSVTAGPTVAAGALKVTGATMSVDQASLSGTCPQTFVFSAALTSEGAGTMTYRLEASADTPGFTFNLPEATQSLFTGAGPRTFNASYTLQFTGSVSGQMWVHILSPVDLESNKVSFSLTCAPAGP